jgi:hypothetical protein
VSRPAALPDGSLLVHIGPQKTGSTAIQLAMHHTRDELAAHGVHYVGTGPLVREAAWFALGLRGGVGRRPPRAQAWQTVLDEIEQSPQPRLCLSSEAFARADDAAAGRVVADLGAGRTHVVFVARRLDRLLPSHWQERVKARSTTSYPDFLRQALEPAGDRPDWHYEMLWGPQDVGRVVGRWARHLDLDRVTVVVSDEDDREVVPRAFETLLGLPADLLVPPATPANRSLDYAGAEAVRRLNLLARTERWTPAQYRTIVQLGVVPALKGRASGDPRRLAGLPDWALAAVAERAEAQIEAIRSSGARVIGDPGWLRIRDRVEPVDLPPEVDEISLDGLAEVVRGAVAGSTRLYATARRAGRAAEAAAPLQIGGRQLLQLLARRTAARMGVRRR